MTSFEIGLIITNVIQLFVSIPVIIYLIHKKNKNYNVSSKETRRFINNLELDIEKFKEKNTFRKEK